MQKPVSDDETLHRLAAQTAIELPEAELTHPFGFGTEVYRVGEKMFMLAMTHPAGHALVNVKCDPAYAQVLRETEPAITPGYHMNKRHWLSMAAGVDQDLLAELITSSYLLIHSRLPRRARPVLPDELTAAQANV